MKYVVIATHLIINDTTCGYNKFLAPGSSAAVVESDPTAEPATIAYI